VATQCLASVHEDSDATLRALARPLRQLPTPSISTAARDVPRRPNARKPATRDSLVAQF